MNRNSEYRRFTSRHRTVRRRPYVRALLLEHCDFSFKVYLLLILLDPPGIFWGLRVARLLSCASFGIEATGSAVLRQQNTLQSIALCMRFALTVRTEAQDPMGISRPSGGGLAFAVPALESPYACVRPIVHKRASNGRHGPSQVCVCLHGRAFAVTRIPRAL